MAWTAPKTDFAPGDILNAAQMNDIGENLVVLRAPNLNQVTVDVNTASRSTNSFADITGMSVSITPSTATSKVLVTVSAAFGTTAGGVGAVNLVRGSTDIAIGTGAANNCTFLVYPAANTELTTFNLAFLDSPATVLATTYKLQWNALAGTIYLNRPGIDGASCGFSSILVQEIPV